jgi:hypothetical protein
MLKDGFEAIISSMKNDPGSWVADDFTMSHKPTGISVWIHGTFIDHYVWKPTKSRFTIWQKLRFRRAFIRWTSWFVIDQLLTEEE